MKKKKQTKKSVSKKKKVASAIPWEKVRVRYVTGEDRPSYRKLAGEFPVSYRSIADRSKKEGWPEQRKKHVNKTSTRVQQKIEDSQVDGTVKEIERLKAARDELYPILLPEVERDKSGKIKEVKFHCKVPDYATLLDKFLKLLDRIDRIESGGLPAAGLSERARELLARILSATKKSDMALYADFMASVRESEIDEK